MKVPVFPQGERDIIDKYGRHVCFANTTEYRDSIIKAINNHEQLYNLLQGAYGYIPEGDCMQKAIEDALKEAEK